MSDAMKKVHPGDALKVPAETFNTFIDAARALKARQQDRRSRPTSYGPDSGIVLVANNSGEDRSRFDVLGVSEPIIRPADNLTEFHPARPRQPLARQRAAVLSAGIREELPRLGL